MRLFALLLVAGCHTGSSNTIAGAAIMSTLALGSSAANRAAGGCYAVCQQGESCNEKTGLCEALPCRGMCRADESCEEGFFGVKCVPGPALAVSTGAVPASTKPAEKPQDKPEQKPQDKPQVPDAARP